ncbi:MMP37-like protein [Cricetulus griseus]|nr:MMP37-like protein [Cricetulus griseus]
MAGQALQSSGVGLRRILAHFPENLSLAFAYGSAVYRQAGPSAQQENPMLDLVFTVDDPVSWHEKNLKKNWSHYSFLKLLGPRIIASVQNNFGAGVYFNPLIMCDGKLIKYGVISTGTLIDDLLNWNNLYIAGRLQKPVKIVSMSENVTLRSALEKNLKSAVTAACLMLPESFSEEDLFIEIAGLSYSGVCLHVYLCPERPEEGIGLPGIGVTDSCEPSCGFWEWNPGLLEMQPVFLATEPTFQPRMLICTLENLGPHDLIFVSCVAVHTPWELNILCLRRCTIDETRQHKHWNGTTTCQHSQRREMVSNPPDLESQEVGCELSGDFRMVIGEEKAKVLNIVKPNVAHFRELYGNILQEDPQVVYKMQQGRLEIDKSPEGQFTQLMTLPRTLQQQINHIMDPPGRNRDVEETLLQVAQDPDCGDVVRLGVSSIVRPSSISQSTKGLFTAGVKKSVIYSSRKLNKMWKGWLTKAP